MSSAIMSAVILQPQTGGAPVQGTGGFSQFIGFGDSAMDSGYYLTDPAHLADPQYEAAVAAGGGLPTSIGGVMNSVLLAHDFGLSAIPVGKPGGTNYAAGGAAAYGTGTAPVPSVATQMQSYLSANGGHADPNALYMITGGGNDLSYAQANIVGAAAQQAYVISDAHQLATAIEQLSAAGARHILLAGATGNPSDGFRDTLTTDLTAAGVSFMSYNFPVGWFSAGGPVESNPAAYGITNLGPPASGPFTSTNPYSPNDGGASLNPNPSQYSSSWSYYATQNVSPTAGETDLYADNVHFAAIGQQIVANDYFNFIETSTPVVSEKLSAVGEIMGNPFSYTFTYQWQQLPQGQTVWSNISGAVNQYYYVQQADVGDQLRALVSYTDSTGQTTSVVTEATPTVIAVLPSPEVLSLSAVTDTHTPNASTGHLVTITMTTSAPVTVIGTPTLQLNDGESATYASGSGTYTLTFDYTVQGSDSVSALQVLGLNLPNGAAIQSSTGSLSGPMSTNLGISINAGLIAGLPETQQIELIYIGYFNRSADSGGFNFWEAQDASAQASVASGGFGQSAAVALTNIANSFAPQAETIALYPFLSNPNPNYSDPTVQAGLATLVGNVYKNLFDRAADSGGQTYWMGQIESGAVGLGAAVLAIANGAQGSDAILLQNKIAVALDFTNLTSAANIPVTTAFLAEAKTVLAGVDGLSLNDASVTAAEALIAPWIASHPNGALPAIVGSALPASHALLG
jgi:hypothetical protein